MRLLPATLLLAAALPALAANPSFDCRKATQEAERMICKDAELADLDLQLEALYNQVRARTPANRQTSLKAEQRDWIAARNDCRSASDARGCIADAYAERIAELERR